MAMEITFDRACLWSFGNQLASNVVIFVDNSSSYNFYIDSINESNAERQQKFSIDFNIKILIIVICLLIKKKSITLIQIRKMLTFHVNLV